MKTQKPLGLSLVFFLFLSVLSMADSQELPQHRFIRLTKVGADKSIGFSRVEIFARVIIATESKCTLEVLVVPTPGPIQALRAHLTWNGTRISETFALSEALMDQAAIVEVTLTSNASSVSRVLLNPGPANPFLEEDDNRRLAINIEQVTSKG